jgi:hypothetical protein
VDWGAVKISRIVSEERIRVSRFGFGKRCLMRI